MQKEAKEWTNMKPMKQALPSVPAWNNPLPPQASSPMANAWGSPSQSSTQSSVWGAPSQPQALRRPQSSSSPWANVASKNQGESPKTEDFPDLMSTTSSRGGRSKNF